MNRGARAQVSWPLRSLKQSDRPLPTQEEWGDVLNAHGARLVTWAPQIKYSGCILYQKLRSLRFTGSYQVVKLLMGPLPTLASIPTHRSTGGRSPSASGTRARQCTSSS